MPTAKPKERESPPETTRRYPADFYRGYSIEELAKMQGVGPVEDFDALLGGWPDEIDDGFEEAVVRWRGHDPDAEVPA